MLPRQLLLYLLRHAALLILYERCRLLLPLYRIILLVLLLHRCVTSSPGALLRLFAAVKRLLLPFLFPSSLTSLGCLFLAFSHYIHHNDQDYHAYSVHILRYLDGITVREYGVLAADVSEWLSCLINDAEVPV